MLAYGDLGHGPAVVLVHGHPFDRSMWRPQLPLGGRFRLVAPDLRGYGKSPATPGAVAMADLAGDVWALMDDVGIDEMAVVGLSMGGLVAMEMALAHPQRVWALGLVATTAQPITESERTERLAMADAVEEAGMGPLVESMAPRLFGPAPEGEMVESVLAMMAGNNPAGAAAALRGRAARPDYREPLRSLRIPSFVCTGTHDPWSTADVTRELVDCLSAPRTLLLPAVGHLPNLERPDEFNAELADFLRSAWEARERAAGARG
jgi:pimeloyl-ACP methyl ester carboxylesterase